MYINMVLRKCTKGNGFFLALCTILVVFTFCVFQFVTLQKIHSMYHKVGEHMNDIVTKEVNYRCENVTMKMLEKISKRCENRLPQSILVGSPKSGTSALLRFMSYHPQIAACLNIEEPRYFDEKYANYSLEWYRNLMPCSTSDQITIEKSPTYFKGNTSALRIKQMNDKTKILIILKDPVEVSISMNVMWKALNISIVFRKTFEDMVTDKNNRMRLKPDSALVRSATYIQHIETWIRLFGKEQVFVLDGTVFESDPVKELHEVEKFLGIDRFYNRSQFVFSPKKNKFCFATDLSRFQCLSPGKGRAHPYVSDELRQKLQDYFKPYNLMLTKLLNRSFTWI